MKRTQQGMTLLGFIIGLAVAGVFIYCGMKVVPMYIEFFAVKKALAATANDSGQSASNPKALRDAFLKRLSVDYSDNVKPTDVRVQRTGQGAQLVVKYEVRRPLIANLDIVGKFEAAETMKGGVGIE